MVTAGESLEGKRIVSVREPTEEEVQGFPSAPRRADPVVLELDDGTVIIPSRDEERNGAGVLFAKTDGWADLVVP